METLVDRLSRENGFYPLVALDPTVDFCVALDLTAANRELTPEIYNNTAAFSAYVNARIKAAGARYAIGGYNEYREIYQRSAVFNSQSSDAGPRRRHLGLDIWSSGGTTVFCPLDGVVHSTGMNNSHGDYGATIILQHQLYTTTFYTLYGHLSADDLNITHGTPVKKGHAFCRFGGPEENGNWPPHLHFQIIGDIGSNRGDYPGVCSESEKEYYLNNCPDPDLIAGLNRYLVR